MTHPRQRRLILLGLHNRNGSPTPGESTSDLRVPWFYDFRLMQS
ncbi:hypothetical protein SAMN04488548_134124 [Gordonia westfalica]|uniref:Uncharacterized protein n=1 Tax=Gordonia westfalica TaxID=158898 RepID=A0A1H2GVB3_9ACTN|nr:hypothetical protein SAMN04488548_134124 [Gordonia westfalica]